MSQVSLGRPEFVPGTPLGHPTAKFLYVIFLYRFFSLHKNVSVLTESFWGSAKGSPKIPENVTKKPKVSASPKRACLNVGA